jgi:hypothetical protein
MIEVGKRRTCLIVAPVQGGEPLGYARAPFIGLKRLRTINHYKGYRTEIDKMFWYIEKQACTPIYISVLIYLK